MSKIHVCTFPDCKSTFQRPSKLQAHLRKHTGERPFACDEENCDKTYTNESHLRRHKKSNHQERTTKTETFKCPVENCGKEFSTLYNMKKHKNNIHTKDYICLICNDGFHKKYLLRRHMEVHTGELHMKCEYCPSTFKNAQDLKKHKYNHKTYTCSCGEVFHRWTVYLKHRKTAHRHEQKHTCEDCNKEFATRVTYKAHLKTHESERTVFECPIDDCKRLYYYKRNLRLHIHSFHMKVTKHLPPSKLKKLRDPSQERKPPKTLETGRKPRKDKNMIKKSTALKLVGLTVPYEAEKSLIKGEEIDAEISDQFLDTSDFSDFEVSIKMLRRNDHTSDSDSATSRMIPVQ